MRGFKAKITLSVFLIAMGWGMIEYREARAVTLYSADSISVRMQLWKGPASSSMKQKLGVSIHGRDLARLGIGFIVFGFTFGAWAIAAHIEQG